MLASSEIVCFIPTTDYDASRAFFVDKLGLEFVSLDQFALVLRSGPTTIRVTKIPGFSPLQGTILGWKVPDVEAAVRWLQSRGVAPEKYPFAQDQQLGIWTAPSGAHIAWFKDPSGNILSLSQHL